MAIAADALTSPDPGAPPLIAGTIRGVRAWTIMLDGDSGHDLLAALGRDVVWPRGRAMRARCVPGAELGDHRAPDPGCTCGIYSHHPYRAGELSVEFPDHDTAIGVVEAWGRVEVHEDGFRAEHARPAVLLADVGAAEPYRERIRRLAQDYGAEYFEVDGPDGIAAHCAGLDDAIREEWVEELLLGERELVLEASADGYLTRRGRAIGGFGYSPAGMEDPSPWKAELQTEEWGVMVVRVAGASYRPRALQAPELAPGSELRLLAEPTNLQDRNAVAIWDAGLRLRAGYVPRSLAPEVGRRLAAGRIGRVVSAWEWRDLRAGERFGLHVLISRAPRVRLVGPGEHEELFEEEEIEW